MLTDITLGQFFPGESLIHKLDARIKILLTFVYMLITFICSNYFSLTITLCSVLFVIFLSKIPIKMYLKSMKMILFIILFTAIINFFSGNGEPIFQWGIFKITVDGINNSIFVSLRLTIIVLTSSILTFVTSPTDMADAIEHLMKPLSAFKINVHDIAMMMTIALRFVPTLLEEADKTMSAQKARGSDLESKNITKKAKALIPIFVPLFVSAFRRAYDLATAMECRCYKGGEGRTRMKILKIVPLDVFAVLFTLAIGIMVIISNTFYWRW
ncbi:MAG: Energy-coupling factor transporter transmembrane protein EcfT [Eubacteriales bacterium SKADARSKE-1]|nr:Energy-coupling factor transporter transmembrane protein EcfT [Eubacteriales bacterium SKADARSKE-1]